MLCKPKDGYLAIIVWYKGGIPHGSGSCSYIFSLLSSLFSSLVHSPCRITGSYIRQLFLYVPSPPFGPVSHIRVVLEYFPLGMVDIKRAVLICLYSS
jgi:hypothetical protein